MVLNLQGQIRAIAGLLPCRHDLNVGTNGPCYGGAKQIQDHLSEHEVTCADLLGCRLIHIHGKRNVSLSEIIFSYTLHLFKNVRDREVRGSLREGTFTDVIDLLKVKNTVKNALSLVECLLGDALALLVKMAVKFLQVDERDFGGLLNLAHNFLSEVIEVLFGIHELLKINHGVQVAHDKELVLAPGHIHVDLVH